MPSIFDLEMRLPLDKECIRIHSFIKKNKVYVNNDSSYYDLYEIIDEFIFLKWKHRRTATSFGEFLDYFGFNYYNFDMFSYNHNEEQNLYYLETLVNLITLVTKDLDNRNDFIVDYYDSLKMHELIKSITENIELTLESCNLKKYNISPSMISFVKRDSEVDSAISFIENRNIALDTLSFLDFRIEKNIVEKKSIITRLYKHLEANQNSYKNIRIKSDNNLKDINPYDDFFMLANKFDIRHHPKELLNNGTFEKLDDKRTLELLDICFRLFLRIINTSQAILDQDYINNLKSEFNFSKQ